MNESIVSEERELDILQGQIIKCRLCPRLVTHREKIARKKRRAYRDWDYWGKPVPSFGNKRARLLLIGLAPGAHGANRTGRMFTGDGSGDFLYAALHRAGFCNQPQSRQPEDGLTLRDCYITAAVRCVPPQNKPSPEERNNCLPYLLRELQLLKYLKVIVALGQLAWTTYFRAREQLSLEVPRPRPAFGHNVLHSFENVHLIGSYHPSLQNTQTGVLTSEMFDLVFARARSFFNASS